MNRDIAKEPLLRFPGFNDEWKKERLGEVSDNFQPKTISSKDLIINGKYPVFGANGYIGYYNKYNVYKETVLISCRGANSGSVNIVPKNTWVTGNSMVIQVIEDHVNKSYLYNYLKSQDLKYMITGTAQPQIVKRDIDNHKISLPSLEEQSKIGSFFKTLDSLIENQESYIEKLEKEKKGLLQDIFSRNLRLLDDNGEKFEGEWKEVKLGDLEELGILELKRGNVISKNDIAEYPGNYPVYSSSILNNGYFGEYGKYMFNEELITWSVDGGGNFFLRKKHKFSITNVSGYIRILKPEKLTYGYLFNQLSYLHGFEEFNYINKAHPSVIRSLYNLNIPSLEEQKAIGLFFKKIDEKIEKEKELLEKYKEMKKGLLQDMFI